MRVLASVYACSPFDGSERAVGWNWIKELDKYHHITAITCHVYKNDIEKYCKSNPDALKNTKFIYVDVPRTSWHKGYRLERLYYILWQRKAFKVAKKLVKEQRYDLVHHITYVTCILPTYMYKLGIPFLYGPVSGGENIPSIIKYPLSKKETLIEKIRITLQIFFRLTPNYYQTMKNAKRILVTTEETKAIIPPKFQYKVRVFQSIGLENAMYYPAPIRHAERQTVEFLAAGRMIYWKGFDLTIQAFLKALNKGCDARLTILGNTENNPDYEAYRAALKKKCGKFLDNEIVFVSSVPHSEMKAFYDRYDVFINCSLRDSGCFVVMEAMSRSLPIICVNTGGPKVNTTTDSALKIEPEPMPQMIDDICDAIKQLCDDPEKRKKMGYAARKYALEKFNIETRTLKMNDFYSEVVE